MDRVEEYIRNGLPKVLDHEGSMSNATERTVVDNAVRFVKSLPDFYRKVLDPVECITPSGHGTIVIDWAHRKNFVSVEIGLTKVGWFSELPSGINSSSDGVPLSNDPPAELLKALDNLFYRNS